MKTLKQITLLALASTVLVSVATQALADPLPGQQLKFQQLPMDGTVIDGAKYFGHDEGSTAYGKHGDPATGIPGQYTAGIFMADDFADEFDTPVVHIRWWGSYINNTNPDVEVRRFLISFEEDVPQDAQNPFSHPGKQLLNQVSDRDADGILTPGSGTFTETLISLGGAPLDEALYEYNAELACPFNQEADTVYWLKIVALVDQQEDGQFRWGWHNRDYTVTNSLASASVVPGESVDGVLPDGQSIYHFQDDAVSGTLDPVIVNSQCNVTMEQGDYKPEQYIDGLDGPGPIVGTNFTGIGAHSKDLAFELYTVPEPSSLVMLLLGAVMIGGRRFRRRGISA